MITFMSYENDLISGHGMIASVSYNGRLIATTGDTNSKMKFTLNYDPRANFNMSFNDAAWPIANVNAVCSAKSSPPMTNPDGYNYESVISANGDPPLTGDGGKVAKWVGGDASRNCLISTRVQYRIMLDLASLAPEPACLPSTDARSYLSRQELLIGNKYGANECGTKELKVTLAVDGNFELHLNGMGKSFSVRHGQSRKADDF